MILLSAGKPSDLDAACDMGISYENMLTMIDSVLVESGYYDVSPGPQMPALQPMLRSHASVPSSPAPAKNS